MAGEVSKKDMDCVLMQVMMAAKNVRAQRDRLLQLQRRLQAGPAAEDHNAKLGELASDLFNVYYFGLEAGAHMLAVGLRHAAKKGARFASNMDFAVITDEEQLHDELLAQAQQLHDELLAQAQQLPARPTTQVKAFARVIAAVLAIKLNEEYLIPRCVECLVGGRALVPGETPDSSPDRDDDLVAAATEGVAKVDLSDDPDATATATATVRVKYGKPRHAASGGGGEVDKALDYLYRACRITSLAVKHIDVAVSVLSRFLDPKDAASLAESSDKYAYISEEGPYPSSD